MVPRSKKLKVAERGEGECSSQVDGKRARFISKIKNIQMELKKINVQEDNKLLEVLQEYSEIRKEIYTRRNEVLHTLKNFWLTMFMSHPVLKEFLNAEDVKILEYLDSLDVEEHPKKGFSISLIFSPNPYFENKKLTKTYSLLDEETVDIIGATIKWKEGLGMGLEDTSFFTWLCNTQLIPFSADPEDEIAGIIRKCLWPDPVKYIVDDNSLHGEGNVQNDDEESGNHDDEIEEKESGEIDAEGGGIDDDDDDDDVEENEEAEEGGETEINDYEIEEGEDETDAEGGGIDAEEGEEDVEVESRCEEGRENDAEEQGQEDDEEVQGDEGSGEEDDDDIF